MNVLQQFRSTPRLRRFNHRSVTLMYLFKNISWLLSVAFPDTNSNHTRKDHKVNICSFFRTKATADPSHMSPWPQVLAELVFSRVTITIAPPPWELIFASFLLLWENTHYWLSSGSVCVCSMLIRLVGLSTPPCRHMTCHQLSSFTWLPALSSNWIFRKAANT